MRHWGKTNANRTMKPIHRLAIVPRALVGAALLLSAEAASWAGRPLEEYEFSLRFPAAITRFAPYGDVAALGGAQAASEYSSSNNPASAAWPHPERKYAKSFSPQFTTVRFAESLDLFVTAQAVAIDAGGWGSFLPAAAQIRSNRAEDSSGLGFRFDAEVYQFQWARRVGEKTTLGANFNATYSNIRYYDRALGEVVRSRSDAYDIRLGLVREFLPRLRVGAVVDYGWSPAWTDTLGFDFSTFRFKKLRTRDTTHQVLWRLGLTWEYADGSDLYLDYSGGTFSNDDGTLLVHRFSLGIEQQLIKDILFGRVGVTLDTRGEVSLTAGLGVTLGTRASLDLAYQHNSFPEIRKEFGQAQSFVASVGLGF